MNNPADARSCLLIREPNKRMLENVNKAVIRFVDQVDDCNVRLCSEILAALKVRLSLHMSDTMTLNDLLHIFNTVFTSMYVHKINSKVVVLNDVTICEDIATLSPELRTQYNKEKRNFCVRVQRETSNRVMRVLEIFNNVMQQLHSIRERKDVEELQIVTREYEQIYELFERFVFTFLEPNGLHHTATLLLAATDRAYTVISTSGYKYRTADLHELNKV